MQTLICKKTGRQTGEQLRKQEKSVSDAQPTTTQGILCKHCHAVVTTPEFAIDSADGFSRTFANPSGHLFEIGCFSRAPGCSRGSDPSSEFTWYPGYDWCIGICRGCTFHLGWIFLEARQGTGSGFYGLILDHLVFP